jgi:hypothetical protein
MKALYLTAILANLLFLSLVSGQNVAPPPNFTRKPERAQPTPSDPFVAELVGISSAILEAGTNGDRAVIERLMEDDYLEIDAKGVLRNKKWNLENFLPPNEKMSFEIVNPHVRRRDGIALLYYTLNIRYDLKTQLTGNSNSVTDTYFPKLQVVDTFVKSSKGWKMIASSRVRLN